MLGFFNFAACIILDKCGVITCCKRPKNDVKCGCDKIAQCVLPEVTMVQFVIVAILSMARLIALGFDGAICNSSRFKYGEVNCTRVCIKNWFDV